ncbi:MAG: hypothetical protein KKB09_07120 [Nanoarchaeota archaeon]|nr:hypothetical protein [Nanoarchaeota archaeon]
MRTESITQEAIGKRIGWERGQVAKYSMILDKIVPENLEMAKKYQTGRGTKDVPNGTIDFTEGGLRELIGLNVMPPWMFLIGLI